MESDEQPLQTGALLQAWQSLTRSGLAASRAHRLCHAQTLHRRALRIACLLFDRPSDGIADDDRIATFVVSHLNLAEACVASGDADTASTHLCDAHRALLTLLHDDSVAEPLRGVASRHLRETHAALIQHWAAHGRRPEILAALCIGCVPLPAPGVLLH